MRKVLMPAAAALMAAALAVAGCAPESDQFPPCPGEDIECFALWSGCRTFALWVEVEYYGGPGEDAVGLSRADVQYAVERRLQASGIRVAEEPRGGGEILQVFVRISGPSFSVDVGFYKSHLRDYRLSDDDRSGVARTWPTSSGVVGGLHFDDAAFVIGIVHRRLDVFLDEWQPVNMPACR